MEDSWVDVRINGRSRDWTVSRRSDKPVLVIDVVRLKTKTSTLVFRMPMVRVACTRTLQLPSMRPLICALTFKFGKGHRFETYPMAVYPRKHPGAEG